MNPFLRHAGVEVPLICGAMYPCSNPELVAAVSEAGGLGVVQPISLVYAHKRRDLREALREIRRLTDKPIGFNAIVEQSSSAYLERMKAWVDVALEEGVRFFVTALGKPGFVVEKAHAAGGFVYHDVTERRFAERALDEGVDGLICVNARAGGHAGSRAPQALFDELSPLGVPLICAGGVGDERAFAEMLALGYAGVQMGTRFIATAECTAHADYKAAIVKARAEDIVLTERLSGVPVAVINTEYVKRTGTRASRPMRFMLRHPRMKHWARAWYSARSIFTLARGNRRANAYADWLQAGRSVDGVSEVLPAGEIVRRCAAALEGGRVSA